VLNARTRAHLRNAKSGRRRASAKTRRHGKSAWQHAKNAHKFSVILLPHAMVMEHAKRTVLVNALMDSTEIPVQLDVMISLRVAIMVLAVMSGLANV